MNSKSFSVAGLALGIVSVCGWFFSTHWLVCIFLAAGIVGICLAAKGSSIAKASNEPKGVAVAGLVCSIVGTALCGIAVLVWVACYACAAAVVSSLY